MALVNQPLERADDERVRLRGVKILLEPREERRVATDRTGVHQCQQEFGIVHFEPRQLVDLPDLVADDQTGVPQRMQHRAQESLVAVVQRAVEHDQQIDVRIEAQVAAAVAAERRDRDLPPGGWRIDHELSNQGVQAGRVPLEGDAAPLSTHDLVAELPSGRVEQHGGARLRPKSRHRRIPYTRKARPRYFPLKLNEYSMPMPMECC